MLRGCEREGFREEALSETGPEGSARGRTIPGKGPGGNSRTVYCSETDLPEHLQEEGFGRAAGAAHLGRCPEGHVHSKCCLL